MKNDYNWMAYNNNTRVIVFNGTKIVTAYSKLPHRMIEIIANHLELYLYGETSMYSGKTIYKAGKKCNDNGGVICLYSTESRAAFNRFVCSYVNTK